MGIRDLKALDSALAQPFMSFFIPTIFILNHLTISVMCNPLITATIPGDTGTRIGEMHRILEKLQSPANAV